MAQLAVGSDGISHAAAASNHHGRSIRLVNQETPTKRARLQKDDDIEERKKKNRLPQKQKRKSARCFVRTSSKRGFLCPSSLSAGFLYLFVYRRSAASFRQLGRAHNTQNKKKELELFPTIFVRRWRATLLPSIDKLVPTFLGVSGPRFLIFHARSSFSPICD